MVNTALSPSLILVAADCLPTAVWARAAYVLAGNYGTLGLIISFRAMRSLKFGSRIGF